MNMYQILLSLILRLADEASHIEKSPTYITIYTDDKVYSKALYTIKILISLLTLIKRATKHTVTIIKLSESERGSLLTNGIKADVKKIKPTAQKKKNIEFIGDSINRVDGIESDHFFTAIQNGAKPHAYLTTKKFNANYNIVTHNGISIFKNVPFNGDNTPFVLPPFYDKLGLTMGPNIFNDGIYQIQDIT